MYLILLTSTLILNIILLFLAIRYKDKMIVGKLFLYIQIAITYINCCNIFNCILEGTTLFNVKEFIECATYVGKFPIFYFVYMMSIALYDIDFKQIKNIPLFIPSILGAVLFLSNQYTNLMIKDYNEYSDLIVYGILFLPFMLYHILLGILSLVNFIIKNYKINMGLSKINLLTAIIAGSILISLILYTFNLLPIKLSSYSFILLALSLVLLYQVKDYKYDTVSQINLANSILALDSGVITFNTYDRVIHYNKKFNDILNNLNIPSIDKLDYKFSDILKKLNNNNNSKIIKETIYLAQNTKMTKLSLLHFKKNNSDIYYKLKVHPIVLENSYIGCMLLFKDITSKYIDTKLSLKNETQNLTQAKIDTIGEMIGCIAHDINTPLSTIKTGTSILIEKYKDDELKNNLLQQIIQDAKKISESSVKVRNQIRNLGNNSVSIFSVNELIKNVTLLYAPELHEHNVEIIFKETEQVEYEGNYAKLSQSIMNILTNAIEAYGINKSKNIVNIHLTTDKNSVYIKIQDFAGGIDEKILPQIFNNIIATTEGTGIGLYLAYSIIKSNFDGDIIIDVTKNVGTNVIISLPKNK